MSVDLDDLEALAKAATPGPWRDVTKDWNDSLIRGGVNYGYHGKLTSRQSHQCACLIVSEPETIKRYPRLDEESLKFQRRGLPDWYDLSVVVGSPDYAYRWQKNSGFGPGRQVHCSVESGPSDRAYIAAMGPDTALALIKRIRDLEAELSKR